jgi:hypothetical protein
VDEARQRLGYLEALGPSEFAFTSQAIIPHRDDFQRAIDWTAFRQCAAQ